MRRAKTLSIFVDVLVRGTSHCDANCPYLEVGVDEMRGQRVYEAHCRLFLGGLLWDSRCQENGYKRRPDCVTSTLEGFQV